MSFEITVCFSIRMHAKWKRSIRYDFENRLTVTKYGFYGTLLHHLRYLMDFTFWLWVRINIIKLKMETKSNPCYFNNNANGIVLR